MGKISVKRPDQCVGCQSCMFACTRRLGDVGLNKSRIKIRSYGGIEKGISIVVCRYCEVSACVNACPTGALRKNIKAGGTLIYNPQVCIGCKNCKDACSIGAIDWDEVKERPLVCIGCGECAFYCPHNVLKFTKKRKGE